MVYKLQKLGENYQLSLFNKKVASTYSQGESIAAQLEIANVTCWDAHSCE